MPAPTDKPRFSEQVFALLEAAPDAMIITDPEGRIVVVNAQAEQVFGYSRAELLGRQVEDLVPDEFRARHPGHRAGYQAHPRPRPMGGPASDLFARRKDGTVFSAEISLSPMHTEEGLVVIAAVRDVTVRKKVEAKFRALLEAAPDAIVITDENRRISLLNAQALSLLWYARADLLGKPVETILPERFRQAPGQMHPLANPDPELMVRRADGAEIPVEVSLRPLETEEGLLTFAALRDISERKQAEQERARLFEAQEAVRARDDFLSIASHELKTPLTPLLIQAQTMLRLSRAGDVSCADLLPKAQKIERSVQRLNTLIGEMLDVSRIAAGRLSLELGEVELGALSDEVCARLESEVERTGSAVHLEHPSPVIGRWDFVRMEQIVSNLVSNALKYGEGRPVSVSVTAQDGWAKIAVSDQGIGIAPEDQARIFQRFERAVPGRKYGGFGLGLWIVRNIVEAHGGVVRVQSALGQGSVFTVEVPQSGPPKAAGHEEPRVLH
ncbi:MAG: PAS domain-containing sensor histidine kinase [Myxococcaceae bacterium]